MHGPSFLLERLEPNQADFPLINAGDDKEVKPLVSAFVNHVGDYEQPTSANRFKKYSSWKRLVKSLSLLKHIAHSFKEKRSICYGWHKCNDYKSVESLQETEVYIVKEVQFEFFSKEIICLRKRSDLPKSSAIAPLSPYLDQHDILRVGGRLSKIDRNLSVPVHPAIIPKNSFLAVLLVRHFHEMVQHQGRHITEGAIRAGGYWIIGGKRTVSRVLHQCVICRKVRGKTITQKMGDLPSDRIEPSPPFTYVGVDVFGPWQVCTRRTRGGSANSKRWAVLFTCLVSRAIHIEVSEELSTSSFINSLRRFIALRGPVKQIRSDRGTNFVGAVNELGLQAVFDEGGPIHQFLSEHSCVWIFNPPHASHMGGAWERMIGIARRILDVMLLNHSTKHLTHEVLVTFLAEVCAIVNSRPIVPVSTDPEDPFVLSPSVLLTQKHPGADYSFQNLDLKDAYRSNWKHVQVLAEEFWRKWQVEYVHSLQPKRKWTKVTPNLQVGDVVLLKTLDSPRGQWPLGMVEKTFPGSDGLTRKVEVRIKKDNKNSSFVGQVTELIHIV